MQTTPSFRTLRQTYESAASEKYQVRGRGRPKSSAAETKERTRRRKEFGLYLRELRESANLTISEAAKAAKIEPPRKLAQYEGACYPPGAVIRALAPVYGVSERVIATRMLQSSDPDLFIAMTKG